MTHSVPTKKIKAEIVPGNSLGYIVINESDFDAEKHEEFVEGEKQELSEEQLAEQARLAQEAVLAEQAAQIAVDATKKPWETKVSDDGSLPDN